MYPERERSTAVYTHPETEQVALVAATRLTLD